jgi:hypothetical protein
MGRDTAMRGHLRHSAAAHCNAIQLRVVAALQFAQAVLLVGISSWLCFPPGSAALPVGLWVMGLLLLITSLVGFAAGAGKRACCVIPYATLATLALIAQAGFVIYLFVSPHNAAAAISSAGKHRDMPLSTVRDAVNVARWVLLGLFAAQVLAVGVALALRRCSSRAAHRRYESLDLETQHAQHTAAVNAKVELLRASVAADGKKAPPKRVISLTATAVAHPGARAPSPPTAAPADSIAVG